MQSLVEAHSVTIAGQNFNRSGYRVAAIQKARFSAEGLRLGLGRLSIGNYGHFGPRGDIEPRLNDTVIS